MGEPARQPISACSPEIIASRKEQVMSFTLARRPAAGLALLAALAAVCTTAATAQPATPKPAATAHHHHSPPMHAAVTTQAASAVPVLRVNRPAPAGVRPGAVGPVPL